MAQWQVFYTGELVSLNHYKSLSWPKLKAKLDYVSMILRMAIKNQKIPPLPYMELRVTHNTRLDMDNVTGMIKPFVDLLREQKVLKDDTKQQWDYLSIAYDPKLAKKTICFTIQSTNYETTNSKTNTGLQKPKRNPKGI